MTSAEASGGRRAPRLGRARTALALVAGAAVLLFWAYVDLARPLPGATPKYDPEMLYLMNSLGVFKSQAYTYVDHPGTPVEVIGTVILAVQKFLLRIPSDSLVRSTLENPQVFLTWAHGLLAVGCAVTVFLLVNGGLPVGRPIDLLPAVAVGLLFFAVQASQALTSLTFWSHNSFNFPAGTLLLVLVALRLRRGGSLSRGEISVHGLLAGGLAAVQLYFATWTAGLSISLGLYEGLTRRSAWRGLGAGLWVGASACAGFLVATGPIIHRYRQFAWWVKSLIVHQGIYGQGPGGITSIRLLWDHFVQLWSQGGSVLLTATVVTVALVVAAMISRWREWTARPWWWAVAVGCLVQLAITVALILKHPGTFYLLAVAAVLPILALLSWETLRDAGRGGQAIVTGLSLVVLAVLIVGVIRSLQDRQRAIKDLRATQEEIARVSAQVAAASRKDPTAVVRLWGYGTPSACYGLRFGDAYAEGLFAREIDQLCPRDFEYNIWTRQAKVGNETGGLGEVGGWDLLVVPSRHLPGDAPVRIVLASSETGLSYAVPETNH